MRTSSSLKATAVAAMAVVAVVLELAATAEAAGSYYLPMPASPDFLLSPVFFLWVTANVIIVFLVSSSRRGGRAAANANDDDGSGEAVVPDAVDSSFYASSSEYEAFSDAAPARASGGRRRADDAPVPVSSRRLPREARAAAAARRSDRPRVRRKPEPESQDAPRAAPPWATAVEAEAAARDDGPPRAERRRGLGLAQEVTVPAVSVPDESSRPRPGGVDDNGAVVGDGDDDVSMDSLWASIVERRAARPVVVQKSESWSNEELPRLQRVAETAAAARRQVRKSVSAVTKASAAAAAPTPTTQAAPPAPSAAAAAAASRQTAGWRTRDVLVGISPDELLRRAESFIRRQREHLRLQRQESEQRQMLLQRRLHGPAPPAPLIRV